MEEEKNTTPVKPTQQTPAPFNVVTKSSAEAIEADEDSAARKQDLLRLKFGGQQTLWRWMLITFLAAHLIGFTVGTLWALISWGFDDVNPFGLFVGMSIIVGVPAVIAAVILLVADGLTQSEAAQKIIRGIWIVAAVIVFLFEALVIRPLTEPNTE